MRRWVIAAVLFMVGATSASAQFQGQYGNQFGGSQYGGLNAASNIYNQQSQPLSPYLNLTRGGNSAVNYYYGVRPGTAAGGFPGLYGANTGNSFQRQTFFPYVDTLSVNDLGLPNVGMRPTGHPAGFNNSLGYFSNGLAGNSSNRQGQMGGQGQGGQQGRGQGQGQSRPSSGIR